MPPTRRMTNQEHAVGDVGERLTGYPKLPRYAGTEGSVTDSLTRHGCDGNTDATDTQPPASYVMSSTSRPTRPSYGSGSTGCWLAVAGWEDGRCVESIMYR